MTTRGRLGVVVVRPAERHALVGRYGGRLHVLKAEGPSRDDASAAAVVAGARKQLRILDDVFRYRESVLVVARAGRTEGSRAFADALTVELVGLQFRMAVHVVVLDRWIENWYLADVVGLARNTPYIRDAVHQRAYEGLDGIVELRGLFQQGLVYDPVLHGRRLFGAVRLGQARRISASLENFLQCVGEP